MNLVCSGMKNLLILFSFFVIFEINAQVYLYPDSLRQALGKLEEKDQVLDLLRIGFYYAQENTDSALHYVNKAENIAIKYQDTLGEIITYRIKGVVYYESNRPDSTIWYYRKGRALAEIAGEDLQLAHFDNNIGMYYWNKGLLSEALEHFYEAKKSYDLEESLYDKAMVSNNIGLIYQSLGDFDKALKFGTEAHDLRRAIPDSIDIMTSLGNLSYIYTELEEYEKSDSILFESLKISEALDYPIEESKSYSGLAANLERQGNYSEAENLYLEAIAISKGLVNQSHLMNRYAELANLYLKTGRFEEAARLADLSLKISDSLQIRSANASALMTFAMSKIALKDQEEGYKALEDYNKLTDSLFNAQKAVSLSEMEVRYETEKKEQLITLQEADIAQQRSINRMQLFISGGGFILISLVGGLWYNRSRYRKQLEIQNLIAIEEKNRLKAVIEAEENERSRIARELHDGLGQSLTAAKIFVGNLGKKPGSDEEQKSKEKSMGLLSQSIQEVRQISHNLMPKKFEAQGLIQALEEMEELINKTQKVDFQLHIADLNIKLKKENQVHLYRIIQELVHNGLKHGDISKIDLSAKEIEDTLSINYRDDGIGLSEEKLANSTGIGYQNMKTRAGILGGSIHINQAEHGADIQILIPNSP
ncbi:tetratricopeptide repeat protein [Algoriphagus marincola]|uniref:histidine kinase n=1 Tax=Algoriphagus marincola TaxID=264027 RepID=A0ABS7N4S2_9BACT|nr:tetratricopeptide repeat protein [Algoriphagus marincola]MBY5951329.1 tetratricopeptide repeat protein [Algoriphagus marincola]